MNKRYLPAPDALYSQDTPFSIRIPNGILTHLQYKLEGDVVASGGGAMADLKVDAPWRLLDRLDVTSESTPIIAASAPDVLHLSTYFTSRKPKLNAPLPNAGNTSQFTGHIVLPLSAGKVTRAALDGRDPTIEVRSRFRPNTQYAGTNLSTINNGRLRTSYAEWAEAIVGTYRRPAWLQRGVDIGSSSSEITDTIWFSEPTLVAGLYMRARDVSESGQAQNTDGLVRRVRAHINRGGRQDREPLSNRWTVWQELGAATWGLVDADVPQGTAIIPTLDPLHPEGLMAFEPGDSIDLVVDTESDVEQDVSAVTPASGDQLAVIPIGWTARTF